MIVFHEHHVEQTEPVIFTATCNHSCFFQRYEGGAWKAVEPVLKDPQSIYK